MAPQWAAQWNVNSHTDPSKVYVVSVAKTGRWACSCPAHRFAKAPKLDCKHIKGVQRVEVVKIAPKIAPSTVFRPSSVKGTLIGQSIVVNTPQQVVLQTRRDICLEDE
jgi:hypothetical protein